MILQTPIINRLKASGPGFISIQGVQELAGIEDSSFRPPAAFVAPVSDTARDNARVDAVRQVVTEQFAVLIVCASSALNPTSVSEELVQLWQGVTDALVGWTYPDAQSPTVYARGRLWRAAEGRVSYELNFTFRRQLTQL